MKHRDGFESAAAYAEHVTGELRKRIAEEVEEKTATGVAAVHAAHTRVRELRKFVEEVAADETIDDEIRSEANGVLEGDTRLVQDVPASAWREPVDFMRARIFDLEQENAKLRAERDDAERRRQADNERNDREGGARVNAHTAERDKWQIACDALARERNVAQENYQHTAGIRDAVRAIVNGYDAGPRGWGAIVEAFDAIRKVVA